MKTVCMLGEGAWGTAVSTLLAANNIAVKLWCYDAQVAHDIQKTGYNKRYMPDILLPKNITPYTDLKKALEHVELIFEAIPVKYLRSVLIQAKPTVQSGQKWIILSKGIEQRTLQFPTQMIDDVLGFKPQKAVMVGPSFAHDLIRKQVTAVTLACSDCNFGLYLQKQLANDYFRPYLSLDMIGVQVGAALKNVIALAIGMLEGAQYQDNAKAFILTRGLFEMVQVSQVLGGKTETLYGLSGVGDLVLTAMGKHSRNFEVGKRLGSGQSLDTILKKTGFIPEGINTAESVIQLAQKYNLELPICAGVYAVIQGEKTIQMVVKDLMERPLEQECQSD